MAFVWELSFNCIIMPSSFISFTVYTLAKLLYQLSLNQSVNINKFSENSTDGFSFPNDRTIWMTLNKFSLWFNIDNIPVVDKWTETLNGLNRLWWVGLWKFPLVQFGICLGAILFYQFCQAQSQLQLYLDWIDLIIISLSASHPE